MLGPGHHLGCSMLLTTPCGSLAVTKCTYHTFLLHGHHCLSWVSSHRGCWGQILHTTISVVEYIQCIVHSSILFVHDLRECGDHDVDGLVSERGSCVCVCTRVTISFSVSHPHGVDDVVISIGEWFAGIVLLYMFLNVCTSNVCPDVGEHSYHVVHYNAASAEGGVMMSDSFLDIM